MNPKRIFCVVGARPNMMKMAPLIREMRRRPDLEPVLIHTGQHYDYSMSQVFFEQLEMPEPVYNLEVGSGTHHTQTAEVMKRFGEIVQKDRPDLIVVVGDVNSTMACALVGVKDHILVAHVESGLRSGDRAMPEEINRIVTDAVSDLLFLTEESARENLHREGIPDEKIHFVGNVMIDSLVYALNAARQSPLRENLGLRSKGYAILTLHRPSNVDDPAQLRRTMDAIAAIARELPVVFPVHPRTAAKITDGGYAELRTIQNGDRVTSPGIWMLPPASYINFLSLVDSARLVITDSGGIQEETTFLGVPCLTYRENTERPITVTHGTNRLIGADPEKLQAAAEKVLSAATLPMSREGGSPPLWDGKAAERIVAILRQEFERTAQ
jgi:UDP-N-acetylglucosamine 2-epimerase (non-hydrolysing)